MSKTKVFISSAVPNLCKLLRKQAPNIVAVDVGIKENGKLISISRPLLHCLQIGTAIPPVIIPRRGIYKRVPFVRPSIRASDNCFRSFEPNYT